MPPYATSTTTDTPHTFAYWDTCRRWARTLNLNNGTDYIATDEDSSVRSFVVGR